MGVNKQAVMMIGFAMLDPLEGWGDGKVWPVLDGVPNFDLAPFMFRTFVNYNVKNDKSPDWYIWRNFVEDGAIWVSEYGSRGYASGSVLSHKKTQLRPDHGRPGKPPVAHRWFIYI